MITFDDRPGGNVPVEVFAEAAAYLKERAGRPVHIALEGRSTPGDSVSSYVDSGMTWWIEAFGWWRGGLSEARQRVGAGPL